VWFDLFLNESMFWEPFM